MGEIKKEKKIRQHTHNYVPQNKTLNKLNEFTARKCLMTQPYMPAGNHVITYDHGGGNKDKQNICIGQSGTKALESKKNVKRKEDEKTLLHAGRGL